MSRSNSSSIPKWIVASRGVLRLDGFADADTVERLLTDEKAGLVLCFTGAPPKFTLRFGVGDAQALCFLFDNLGAPRKSIRCGFVNSSEAEAVAVALDTLAEIGEFTGKAAMKRRLIIPFVAHQIGKLPGFVALLFRVPATAESGGVA
jgi:hypothetical protein